MSVTALWVVGYLSFSLAVNHAASESPRAQTDAIIVFTGAGGRVETGLDLFAQEKAPKIFISGIHEDTTLEDIQALYDGKHGELPCCIELGYQAGDTRGNALESAEWVSNNNVQSVRLVTSDYHLPRAVMEFSFAAGEVTIYSHPVKRLQDTKRHMNILREYHKVIATYARQFFFNQ